MFEADFRGEMERGNIQQATPHCAASGAMEQSAAEATGESGGDGAGGRGGEEEDHGEPVPSTSGQMSSPLKAFLASAASDPTIPRGRGGRYCVVVGCHNNQKRDGRRGIKFHSFPKTEERRKQWILAIRRSVPGKPGKLWEPSQHSVVCSEHFRGGRKSNDKTSDSFNPSVFPTHQTGEKSASAINREKRLKKFQENRSCAVEKERKQGKAAQSSSTDEDEAGEKLDHSEDQAGEDMDGREIRPLLHEEPTEWARKKRQSLPSPDREPPSSLDLESSSSSLPQPPEPGAEARAEAGEEGGEGGQEKGGDRKATCFSRGVQANINSKNVAASLNLCDNVSSTEKAVQVSQNIFSSKQVQTVRQKIFRMEELTEKQLHAFCGVSKAVVKFLTFKASTTLQDSRLLSKEEKILLFLIRIKLNLQFSVLGAHFNVSEATALRAYQETVKVLYEIAKNNLVWFPKEIVRARMPPAFQALFPKTRAIIDCSEIKLERPGKLRQRVLTYSHYKSDHTVKFLVAIAPSGEIMFVSKSYGGRATDTEITCNSGFLNLVEEGDVILADKGFPKIESNINAAGGLLVIPPFKSGGRQFSNKENQDGYKCACVRVHVERAIARMKIFKSLKIVPLRSVKDIDKIITIVSFLCNLMPDLIKVDEEKE